MIRATATIGTTTATAIVPPLLSPPLLLVPFDPVGIPTVPVDDDEDDVDVPVVVPWLACAVEVTTVVIVDPPTVEGVCVIITRDCEALVVSAAVVEVELDVDCVLEGVDEVLVSVVEIWMTDVEDGPTDDEEKVNVDNVEVEIDSVLVVEEFDAIVNALNRRTFGRLKSKRCRV